MVCESRSIASGNQSFVISGVSGFVITNVELVSPSAKPYSESTGGADGEGVHPIAESKFW